MKIQLSQNQVNLITESIDRNNKISELKEDLFLKKNTKNNTLLVFSDKEDSRGKFQETSRLAKSFNKLGFRWDSQIGNWVGPVDKLTEINELIKSNNKIKKIVTDLEMIEEFIQSADKTPDNKSLLMTKMDQYIDDLINATDQASMDSAIRRYLSFYSKFHHYSLVNTWLIYIQKPDATKVAGFNTWKQKGRAVKSGAKGIGIWYPMNVKQQDIDNENVDFSEVDQAGKTGDTKMVTRFRIGYVFDVSDTYATSEKGEVPDEPVWHSNNEPSEVADEIVKRLKEMAEALSIRITKDESQSGEKGYSAGEHINLSSDVEGVGEASTLIHEMAHELLHWRGKSIFKIEDDELRTRDMMEIQAESVSYMVLKHYDLPVTHHPTYLVLWKANKEKLMKNLDIIRKCSQYIIEGIDALSNKDSENNEPV